MSALLEPLVQSLVTSIEKPAILIFGLGTGLYMALPERYTGLAFPFALAAVVGIGNLRKKLEPVAFPLAVGLVAWAAFAIMGSRT